MCLTVSGWVTVRQEERLLVVVPHVPEIIDREHNLVEERDEADRVSRRAFSAINTIGVGHMRLVIGRIQVLSVPAAGEENLKTESIIAVLGGKLVGFRGSLVAVEACKSNGPLFLGVGV